MILGMGCDIIEICRIQQSIEKNNELFLNKIFTPLEQGYCHRYKNPFPHYAARFAGKEAISKAFAVGIGSVISWLDMEIDNDENGNPCVRFQPRIDLHFNHPTVKISLSHCKEYAMAVAIWSQ
jgi:holo-[acyl-carrier protein] synthase